MKPPRFTLDTLQHIDFPADPDTPAVYTFNAGKKPVTIYAKAEELTAAEQGAALAFILRYCRAHTVKRGTRRRANAAPAADIIEIAKHLTITIEEIEDITADPDYSKLIDTAQLEQLLSDTSHADKGTPREPAPADGGGNSRAI